MKHSSILVAFLFSVVFLTTGCQRSSNQVWDDTKTAGRYMGRGMRSIGGKHGDSKQVRSREEFGLAKGQDDFVPLEDGAEYNKMTMSREENAPHSRHNPGDPNSPVPGIEAFEDPSKDPTLAQLFSNIHFDYNSDLVKGEDNMQTIQKIADHLKKHGEMYIFVEGHCDERGPQAYNLALGTRRSNAVRNLLVKEGISADRLFTISYGKERPLVLGNTEEAFNLNRRAQFKVYAR